MRYLIVVALLLLSSNACAQRAPTLAMEGDSIMALMYFPLKNLVGKKWNLKDYAVSGSTVSDLNARASTTDSGFVRRIRNELLIWVGTNDGGTEGDTAAATAQEAQTYLSARKTKGWQITFFAMLPRSAAIDKFVPNVDSFRSDYNFMMHVWTQANGVRFYDPTINIAGLDDPTNTTYYVDGLHPTTFALNMVAKEVLNLLGPPK